jgi:hypothetical protein
MNNWSIGLLVVGVLLVIMGILIFTKLIKINRFWGVVPILLGGGSLWFGVSLYEAEIEYGGVLELMPLELAPVTAAPLAAPLAQVAAPLAQVTAAPLAQVAAPLAQVAAPLAQVAAPLAQVAAPLAQVAAPLAQVAAPLTDEQSGLGLVNFTDEQ